MEKAKKMLAWALIIIFAIIALIGWGLYEKFGTGEPSTKTATAENKSVAAGCVKPQVTLYTPVEPPKPKQKRNSASHHKATPVPTPEKTVVVQGPKEGTECVVGEHHGVVKMIDGKINCVWEEAVKEAPTFTPPVKLVTTPVQQAQQPVAAPVEQKSLLDGVDPDYGKTKSGPAPAEAPPRTRKVVVVIDRPQYYGGWYNYPLVPSPYYYTTSTPVYTPTVVAAPSVVTPAPSVVRPPAVITMPATAGTGRAPTVVTR